MATQNIPTSNVVYPRHRTALIVFIAAAVLLLLVVFFAARCEGIRHGRHDAREKIEKENDITAGPTDLMH